MKLLRICWVEVSVFVLWLAFVLFLSGCAGVKPPDARWGVVNPAGAKVTTYHLRKDYTYTEDGMRRKPSAKPVYIPIESLWDLEGWVCMSPADVPKVRTTLDQLISRYREGCSK